MKKVIWFFILVLLTLNVNSQSIFRRGVKIGNDKVGSDVVQIDSATTQGTDVTFYKAGAILNARNIDTVALSSIGVMKADSNINNGYVTLPYLNSVIGGGSGFSYYSKEFAVGDTGFPGVATRLS